MNRALFRLAHPPDSQNPHADTAFPRGGTHSIHDWLFRRTLVRQPRLAPAAPALSGRRSLRRSSRRQDGHGCRRRFHLIRKETSHRALYDSIDGAEVWRREEKIRRRNAKETFR
jgi:hypothetical protein